MLKNKTIAITGARGRIGACLAEEVIKNNGKVLLGDIQPLQATQLPRNQYLYPNFSIFQYHNISMSQYPNISMSQYPNNPISQYISISKSQYLYIITFKYLNFSI